MPYILQQSLSCTALSNMLAAADTVHCFSCLQLWCWSILPSSVLYKLLLIAQSPTRPVASATAVAWPGWYIHISDGTAEADAIYATATDGSSNSTMTKFRRCPPNTFNNGHNTATTCVDCPIGTSTRFDIDKRDYYYNSEYYDRYHVAANTEDMCGEHAATIHA